MYLINQIWSGLLAAALLGAAVGCVWGLRRCERGLARRLALVRHEAMLDAARLRSELADTQAWHGRELSDLRAAQAQAVDALGVAHLTELQAHAAAHREALKAAQTQALQAAMPPPDADTLLPALLPSAPAAEPGRTQADPIDGSDPVSRADHDAVVDDLTEQLDASRQTLRQTLTLRDAREARLSAEIIEIRAELDRLRQERTDAALGCVRQHRPTRLALLDAADVERLARASGAGHPPPPTQLDGGVPDDLQRIDGVDAAAQAWLHGMGIFYFWQIAAWAPEEVAWVAQHLPGRSADVWRCQWVARSARLAARDGLGV